MNLPVDIPESPPGHEPRPAHAELMTTLERLLTVGAFYPTGHAKCEEVVREFHAALAAAAPGEDALRLEAKETSLCLQGTALDPGQKGTVRWHTLLHSLGIAQLEIQANASAGDLHDLVNQLLALNLEAESSLQFKQLNFDELPASVHVRAREFGFQTGQVNTEAAFVGMVNTLLAEMTAALKARGLDHPRITALRKQVEGFLIRLIDRLEATAANPGAPSAAEQRQLQEILSLEAQAIRGAVEALGQDMETSGVSVLFGHATDALTYSQDKESVAMIMEAFRRTSAELQAAETEPLAAGPQPDTTTYDLSLPELGSTLRKLSDLANPLVDLHEHHQQEILAIALTLLTRTPAGPALDKILANVSRLLPETDPTTTATLMDDTIRNLLATGDIPRLDQALPILLAQQSGRGSVSFLSFWENLCETAPDSLRLGWPHLVNRALQVEIGSTPRNAAHLMALAGRLPLDQARAQLSRLEQLGAWQTGKFNPDFMQLPPAHTRVPLDHLLRGEHAAVVGKQLANAWRTLPPNTHAQYLLPALGPWQEDHLPIYRQLLDTAGHDRIPGEFGNDIAQLVSQHLLALKPSLREKHRVLQTLRYLGGLGSPRCRPVLDKIINQKKFIFFPRWPAKTRLEAQQARDMLAAEGPS